MSDMIKLSSLFALFINKNLNKYGEAVYEPRRNI